MRPKRINQATTIAEPLSIFPRRFERGQVLLLFVAALPAIMAIIALMVDIGGASIAYHRAQVTLDAATFAGAQVLEDYGYAGSQRVRLDEGGAVAQAHDYLQRNQQAGSIQASFYVVDDIIYGMGSMNYKTFFLGGLGMDVITIRVNSAASPGWGITDERQ